MFLLSGAIVPGTKTKGSCFEFYIEIYSLGATQGLQITEYTGRQGCNAGVTEYTGRQGCNAGVTEYKQVGSVMYYNASIAFLSLVRIKTCPGPIFVVIKSRFFVSKRKSELILFLFVCVFLWNKSITFEIMTHVKCYNVYVLFR